MYTSQWLHCKTLLVPMWMMSVALNHFKKEKREATISMVYCCQTRTNSSQLQLVAIPESTSTKFVQLNFRLTWRQKRIEGNNYFNIFKLKNVLKSNKKSKASFMPKPHTFLKPLTIIEQNTLCTSEMANFIPLRTNFADLNFHLRYLQTRHFSVSFSQI